MTDGSSETPHDVDWAEVYDELRRLASSYMNGNLPLHTLQPTAVVNEAFLKMGEQPKVQDKAHFLARAATAMRHILVDHAKAKRREKRGGDRDRVTLDAFLTDSESEPFDVLAVEEALQRLATLSERQSRIVEMRVFGGMTIEQVARAIEMSERTVKGDWQIARAWLRKELAEADERGGDESPT